MKNGLVKTPDPLVLKERLQVRGLTYRQVAQEAGVSWRMVAFVMAGDRRSDRVLQAVKKLTRGRRPRRRGK